MPSIQVHFLTGSQAGRRVVISEPAATFGRELDNVLVIDDVHVSRRHGELRFEQGQWLLINHSANGTWVNKKRAKKPTALRDGDVISVDGEALFSVQPETPAPQTAAAPTAPADTAAPQTKPAGAGLSRRAKLWIGIGVYLLMLTLAALFFMTLSPGNKKLEAAPELTRDQILAEVRQLPRVTLRDEQLGYEHLQKARALFARRDQGIDTLFQAHENYQLALVHLDRSILPSGQDQLNFREVVEPELSEKLVRLYKDAYAHLRSGEYREAEDAFYTVMRVFPDPSSALYQNCVQQAHAAGQKNKKRR